MSIFCNYCGAANPDDALFCSACGRSIKRQAVLQRAGGEPLPTEDQRGLEGQGPVTATESFQGPEAPPSDVAPAQPSPTTCLHCGAALLSNAAFCVQCGKALTSKEPAVPFTVYATMSQRFSAYFADLIVIYLIVFAIFFLSGVVQKPLSGSGAESYGIFFAVLFTYMTVAQACYHTTVGKYVVGLEVSSARFGETYPSFWRILSRETVGRLVSSFFYGMGYWFASRRPMKQAWSDQMADTVVRNRPTNPVLRKALTAFVLVAFVADVGLFAWGQYYEDRTKRYDAFAKDLQSVATQTEQARDLVNQAVAQETRSLQQLRPAMQGLLPLLDRYDSQIARMQTLIDRGFREDLYASEAERNQFRILQQVWLLRKEQSAKLREEADLIISYDPLVTPLEDLHSHLKLLDSDIDGLDHRASQLLAQAGLR